MSVADGVYLVYTPYQLIQALNLARNATGRRYLLAIPRLPIEHRILQLLAERSDNPFLTINIVEASRPVPGLSATLARQLGAARNVRRLSSLVAGFPGPVGVYTANTQTVEGQALIAAAVERPDSSPAYALEDGLATYEKRPTDLVETTSPSRFRSWLRQLYLGRSARRPAGRAPLENLAGIYATYPEALPREAWTGVQVLEPPPASAILDLVGDLARSVVGPADRTTCRSLDALLVLPHSRLVTGRDRAQGLVNLLDQLVERGLVVGLKYHPRESQLYLSSRHRQGVHELSPEVPVEFFFALADSRMRWIISGRTTAVLSGPQFCPNAQTIMVALDPSTELLEAHRRLAGCTGAILATSPTEAVALLTEAEP